MPRNGSGTSSVINTFVIDTVADPDEVNANFTDVADQLTNSLPRDGQAGMNAPLPLQNGTDALPALTFSSDPDTGLYRRSANTLGISLGGVGYPLDAGVVYAAKSGNYTAVLGDNNAVHRYTATATVTLTAAATLATNWHYTIIADGADVTIDPNASETINGLTTLIVKNGTSAEIICNGTNFFTVLRTQPWELIGDFTVAAASASLAVTDLSAYRKLRISGNVIPSAITQFLLRTSTNNGSSYDSGAADYVWQTVLARAAVLTAGNASANGIAIFPGNIDASLVATFEMIIENFNKATPTQAVISSFGTNTGATFAGTGGGARQASTARNALQILPSSGTFSGQITIEGMRG